MSTEQDPLSDEAFWKTYLGAPMSWLYVWQEARRRSVKWREIQDEAYTELCTENERLTLEGLSETEWRKTCEELEAENKRLRDFMQELAEYADDEHHAVAQIAKDARAALEGKE